MSNANETQVGGAHYQSTFQHWDFVTAVLRGRYLEGCITKYVTRWRKKNGVQDLEKALHYLAKLREQYVLGIVTPLFSGVRYDQQCREFVNANDKEQASPTWRLGNLLQYEIIEIIAHWIGSSSFDNIEHKIQGLLQLAQEEAVQRAQKATSQLLQPIVVEVDEAMVAKAIGEAVAEYTPSFTVVGDVTLTQVGEIYTGTHRLFDFTAQPDTGAAFAQWIYQCYQMLNVGFDKWGQAWIDADEEEMRRGLRDALAEDRCTDAANYLMFLYSRTIGVAGRTGSQRIALANRFLLDEMAHRDSGASTDGSQPAGDYTNQG